MSYGLQHTEERHYLLLKACSKVLFEGIDNIRHLCGPLALFGSTKNNSRALTWSISSVTLVYTESSGCSISSCFWSELQAHKSSVLRSADNLELKKCFASLNWASAVTLWQKRRRSGIPLASTNWAFPFGQYFSYHLLDTQNTSRVLPFISDE